MNKEKWIDQTLRFSKKVKKLKKDKLFRKVKGCGHCQYHGGQKKVGILESRKE